MEVQLVAAFRELGGNPHGAQNGRQFRCAPLAPFSFALCVARTNGRMAVDPRKNENYVDWMRTLEEDIFREAKEDIFDRFWAILEPVSDEEVFYAFAASEVVAAVRGNPGSGLSKRITEWAKTVGNHLDEQIARNAYNFVARNSAAPNRFSEYASELKTRLA